MEIAREIAALLYPVPVAGMNPYDEFRKWLEQNDEKLNPWQAATAHSLLTMPVASGKSWIIERLMAFEVGGARATHKEVEDETGE